MVIRLNLTCSIILGAFGVLIKYKTPCLYSKNMHFKATLLWTRAWIKEQDCVRTTTLIKFYHIYNMNLKTLFPDYMMIWTLVFGLNSNPEQDLEFVVDDGSTPNIKFVLDSNPNALQLSLLYPHLVWAFQWQTIEKK